MKLQIKGLTLVFSYSYHQKRSDLCHWQGRYVTAEEEAEEDLSRARQPPFA